MSEYISAHLRELVIKRANGCCEYCLVNQDDSYLKHHIDHIISLKHGGKTIIENLAYACFPCNIHKGSNLSTIIPPENKIVRIYNPRTDVWSEHFDIENGKFYGKTEIGLATIKLLKLNDIDRIIR